MDQVSFKFGDSRELSDRLTALVRTGAKTATCGALRDFISGADADETLFKAILRNMDFGRQQFDKSIEHYSEGQKKKLLLARSLCTPAHLYVWDEPMNYIDVFSRMQLETLLTQYKPTLLMVEHDRAFLEKVCTGIVEL